MKNQIISNKLEFFVYPIFLIFGYIVSSLWGYTMLDDGWRHLSMAFNKDQVESWGNIFIHSLYKDYDPWFLWHHIIKTIGHIFGNENAHVVINSIVYFALSSWYYIILSRYTNINLKIVFILSLIMPSMSVRYFYLRPDIFSGLFLLYFMLIKRKSLMILITLIYMPFYYVFWFYLGYIGIVKLYLKKYKDLFILIGLTIIGFTFHLYYDTNGFIETTLNVLNNDKLLQGYSVSESQPLFIPLEIKNFLGSTTLLITMICFSFLIHYVFKPKDRVLELLIFLMPLILLQARFFQLLSPLIYVYSLILAHSFYKNISELGIDKTISNIVNWIKEKSYFGQITKKSFRIISLISLSIFLILSFMNKLKFYNEIDKSIIEHSFLMENEYKNKRILLSTMDITLYLSTLLNPSSQYIPSCSLGWVDYDEKNKNTYFKLFAKKKNLSPKEFFEFLEFNKIDIFIIKADSNNVEFSNDDLNKYGYKFSKLYKKHIVYIKN